MSATHSRGGDRRAAHAGAQPTAGRPLARVPAGALVLGGIASVQFGSSLAATLFSRIGPGGTVFLRLLFAMVVLLVLWRPRVRERTRAQLALACLFGLVLACMNLSFYEALSRIPLGIAVAVEFVGPLAVAIGGSRRRLDVLWVLLAVVGIVLLTHGSTRPLSAPGVGLAALAGCFWAAYILVNARVGRAFEDSGGLAIAMVLAALVMAPVGIASGGTRLLDPALLAQGAAVGVLSSAIPYSLELEALRRIAAPTFGVLMSLEPAVAALAGFLVLGQSLATRALLGIACVVLASLGASASAPAPDPPVQV